MNVRYRVELSETERVGLRGLIAGGKAAVRRVKRAQILLAADAGRRDEEIAAAVGVGTSTVYRVKRRLVQGNLEHALAEAVRPGAQRKLSGNEEALLVATACSAPPAGRARWTLVLLAGALVKLTEHTALSRETVRRRLEENELKPWRKDMWCISHVDSEFVARMEDVLDLYAERADARRPVVCFDESPTQHDVHAAAQAESVSSRWRRRADRLRGFVCAVTAGWPPLRLSNGRHEGRCLAGLVVVAVTRSVWLWPRVIDASPGVASAANASSAHDRTSRSWVRPSSSMLAIPRLPGRSGRLGAAGGDALFSGGSSSDKAG